MDRNYQNKTLGFTQEDNEIIGEVASKMGVTFTSFVRQSALIRARNYLLKFAITKEEKNHLPNYYELKEVSEEAH